MTSLPTARDWPCRDFSPRKQITTSRYTAMSLEESRARDGSTVDPATVDWAQAIDEFGSEGKLGMLERTDAVQAQLDEINADHEAERVVAAALEAGLLERGGGNTLVLPDDGGDRKETTTENDDLLSPDTLDWPTIFRDAAGSVTDPFPNHSQGTYVKLYSDRINDATEGKRLFEKAIEAGIIEDCPDRENGRYFLANADSLVGQETATDDESDPDVDTEGRTDDVGNAEHDVSDQSRAELEKEVQILRSQTDALSTKLNRLAAIVLGDRDTAEYDVDEIGTDLRTQLNDIEERVNEHDDKLAMYAAGGSSGPDDPDSRATKLRQVLYNSAKATDGTADLTRDEAESALNGGLHRESVLDAMKRAADGQTAGDDERSYRPINGASSLPPCSGITFKDGSLGGGQSYIVLELSDMTGAEIRQKLTTGESEEEG